MALNFPSSPSVGQVFTDSTSGNTYRWTGTYWKSYITANPATDFGVVNLNVSGVTSTRNLSVTGITTLGNASVGVITAFEVDVSGVTTSQHLQVTGVTTTVNIIATGIATVGSTVTISSSGINAPAGIITAASFVGSGSDLTGLPAGFSELDGMLFM